MELQLIGEFELDPNYSRNMTVRLLPPPVLRVSATLQKFSRLINESKDRTSCDVTFSVVDQINGYNTLGLKQTCQLIILTFESTVR